MLYRRAEQTLRRLGVPSLVVDTTDTTPASAAERIASALRALASNVARGPTDPAAAGP
ncbi:hypothetical protein [Streptomyces sp. NPDC046985]|uniref:hypothetical protein n=1 Tax=Streptomyces sp. NPDC046985 TaxID=3155377 RepID=UPI0033C14F94